MPDEFNKTEWTSFPCALKLGAVNLGGTEGPVAMKWTHEYTESTCNQARGVVQKKTIKSIKCVIEAKCKEVAKIRAMYLDGGKVTAALIGHDIFEDAQLFEMAEIGGTKTHSFPAAVLLRDRTDTPDGEKEDTIDITIEAKFDANGVMYELKTTSTTP